MSDLTDRLRDGKTVPLMEERRAAADEIDKLLASMASERHRAFLLAERVKVLEQALALAYGHLWCINTETNVEAPVYPAMQASYEARKIAREVLTVEQRGDGITAARAALKGASHE